jgi:hypothetical protein
VQTPLLVVGAQCDGSFRPDEVREMAPAYRTEAEPFSRLMRIGSQQAGKFVQDQ